MAKVGRKPGRPATSADERELQLMSLATDLAEKQLREGTAPAVVVVHYLKASSGRERLERERLQNENLLLSAKVDAMASAKRVEELYEGAIQAMRQYTGQDSGQYEEEYYE